MLPSINSIFNTVTFQHVDKKDGQGETRLYKAVRQGSVAQVRKLLREGANPNIKTHQGLTPLHQAAYWGEDAIVEMLIKAGAKPNIENGQGWTALHSAAISGGEKVRGNIIALLKKAGARDDVQDIHGWTAKDYMQLWDQDAISAKKVQDFIIRELASAPEEGRQTPRKKTSPFRKH